MRLKMHPVDPDYIAEPGSLLGPLVGDPGEAGKGEVDHYCGHCEALVVPSAFEGELVDLVVQCGRCGGKNLPTGNE